MNEPATLIVAIIGALIVWTTSVISLSMWLASKFRALEKTIYREMDKHRKEDDRQFTNQGTRIQRLELKIFGFTHSGITGPRE